MKNIFGIIGFTAIALLVMSSTCTSEVKGSEEQGSSNKVAIKKGEGGIEFSKMTLEEAKKEARATGKMIFIDAYTDWCGPCKKMAASTFTEQEVGEVFNSNFINLKIEMEKNPDGKEVARMYNVRAYPTLIIIDGEGNLVKQTIGFQTKERIISFAKSVL
jgi:thiol:disulfide interchange protein